MNFHRQHQRLLTALTGVAGMVVISVPSVLTGAGNSILNCRNVFCAPGDTTENVMVELDSDPADSVAGFQFDLYTDSRYFTPLGSEPWDIYGLDGWLYQTAIRNDSAVAFIAVDSLLTEGHLNTNLAYNYLIQNETPSGFYPIQPTSVMISGIAGDGVGYQMQSGTIVVSTGNVYIKIADDTVRVGQDDVVLPIYFVAKEAVRSISFEIADSAHVVTLKDISAALPPGWTETFSQDSVGTISYCAQCDASLELGYPIESNEILTINLTVDINRNILAGIYVVKTRDELIVDAASGSGFGPVESIAGRLTIIDSTAAIQSEPVVACQFTLTQNYPNPFNFSTTIGFTLTQPGHVQIEVYNLLGQLVRTLVFSDYVSGTYTVKWDGRTDSSAELNSGIYFYRISAEKQVITRKMVLLK